MRVVWLIHSSCRRLLEPSPPHCSQVTTASIVLRSASIKDTRQEHSPVTVLYPNPTALSEDSVLAVDVKKDGQAKTVGIDIAHLHGHLVPELVREVQAFFLEPLQDEEEAAGHRQSLDSLEATADTEEVPEAPSEAVQACAPPSPPLYQYPAPSNSSQKARSVC